MSTNIKTPRRVGIYSGSFDPVHVGHVAFALQAIEAAKLDEVYFLPERRPRSKLGVEHFGHRVAMLKHAAKPHPSLKVLELEDVSFSVARTLPRLQKRFKNDQLVLLVGSDVAAQLPAWENYEQLCKQVELVVGVRATDTANAVADMLAEWSVHPVAVTVLDSFAASVSSRQIREALRRREAAPGLLPSVERYSDHNWLYVSLVAR